MMHTKKIMVSLLQGKQLFACGSKLMSAAATASVHQLQNKQGVQPKTAILMLNMGGPKTQDEVAEFLLRIMTDRDMIQLPMQSALGPYIAKKRTEAIKKKYNEIGGGSPILKWTELQGDLLCKKLDNISPSTAPHKYFVAFRYANPLTDHTLQQLQKEGVEHTVVFSQYPQYSCATSGSSFNAIYSYYAKNALPSSMTWSIIDRWSSHPLLVKVFADRIKTELAKFSKDEAKDVVILFSAHSLPLKAVNRGDPYPSEVGATVELVMKELGYCNPYALVWQSKVGPTAWLGPFTDDAIKGYVKQGKKNFVLVPIAFVNEHIETLHELDIEYCHELPLLEKFGDVNIKRAAAPNDHPIFIDALADLVANHLKNNSPINPKFLTRCPHCTNQRCHLSKQWWKSICKMPHS